ncbi:MAG TPA: tRNA (guanosine(37)-N1)-methyltransferase TrmD [Candidatus Eremiobacteraceae bacterium]|jgi:tRNA (guanine37-N1)-methyltransferase|nr:tRNA (guanosine(37)-N1)-methyltransferase TrmD [Candidatus Eremiobacteraceae bacterium]
MRIDIVTLFSAFFEPIISGSILGRAQEKGAADIRVHDLWRYVPAGERADDAAYGGGAGMVIRLGPLVACLEDLLGPDLALPKDARLVVPSPAGQRFDHAMAAQWSTLSRLIIVCGHYEGIDERLFDLVPAEEVSLGDFVLTGGEVPALAFVDACVRLLPGVIAQQSAAEDSFADGALDWPHYTRPAVFRGVAVPDVLLSGDHAKIEAWRREQSRTRTRARRPDLDTP